MDYRDLVQRLKELLSQRGPWATPMQRGLIKAAVLVPLLIKEGGLSVLLVKRAKNLPHHPGEVSFPGGRCEEGDNSLEEAALREAYEEVGLDPKDVQVVGRLNDVVTTTRFLVSPFVGVIPYPYPFRPNEEVEEVLLVPLCAFKEHKAERRLYRGQETLFYQVQGHTVWGATAKILTELVGLLSAARFLCT